MSTLGQGPSKWEERKEAKRQMYLQSTEKGSQTIFSFKRDEKPKTQQCQKCLLIGHWTYQCKTNAVYNHRPSRSAIMKNPTLIGDPRIPNADTPPVDPREQMRNEVSKEMAKRLKKKKRKKVSRSSSSSSESESDSDSETSSQDSKESSSESSYSESSSSESSSSESDSDQKNHTKKRKQRSPSGRKSRPANQNGEGQQIKEERDKTDIQEPERNKVTSQPNKSRDSKSPPEPNRGTPPKRLRSQINTEFRPSRDLEEKPRIPRNESPTKTKRNPPSSDSDTPKTRRHDSDED